MARSINLYSRFVTLTKIILPLIALGILSSLFLLSGAYDASVGVTRTDEQIREISNREGIARPRFAGTTSDGVSISLSAANAKPGTKDDQSILATDMRAHIEMPSGASLNVVAKDGFINADTTKGELSGGIFLETSFGYTAVAEGLRFTFDRFRIDSIGAIAATSPSGDISAGELHVYYDGNESDGGYVLVFEKGVMLVYNPNQDDQE